RCDTHWAPDAGAVKGRFVQGVTWGRDCRVPRRGIPFRQSSGGSAMPDGFILEIPEQMGQPVAAQRSAQAKTRDWPAGTRIISADSHMLEGDLWVDRFPAHLKDAAPRMVFKDGGWDLSIGGKSMTPPAIAQHLCGALECY